MTATFSEAMMASSINATTLELFGKELYNQLSAAVRYDAASSKATLNPANNLRLGTTSKLCEHRSRRYDRQPPRPDKHSTGLQQKTWLFR